MVAVVRRLLIVVRVGGSTKACVCRETLRACDEAITSGRGAARHGAKGLALMGGDRPADSRFPPPFLWIQSRPAQSIIFIGGKKLSGESIGINVPSLGLNILRL
jgi:hypothetical protein